MESLGLYIKNLREEKGFSLEDINEKSKIPMGTLLDIEDNNFRDIGGYGYAKATVASYGKIIGANEYKILTYLKEYFNVRNEIVTRGNLTYEAERKYIIPIQWLFYFLLFILVIILGAILLNFYKKGLIHLPFERKAKTEQVEDVKKEEAQKDEPKESSALKIKVKQKEEHKPKNNETQKEVVKLTPKPKIEEKKAIVKASNEVTSNSKKKSSEFVNDKNDYINDLMFEGKKSPLNTESD